jgi:hypothetical protein
MSVELLVADMQQRFGFQAFCRAAELAPTRETLPTGIRAVDELLDGGLLRGATHCLSGEPTSGATSLLYQAVASAQAQGLPVVYLDMGRLLDPPNAAAAGVQLERLLLLRGTPLKQALFLIRSLAQQRLPCLLALDHPATTPLAQLKAILRDAPLTLLALSPSSLPGPLGGGEYGYRARGKLPTSSSLGRPALSEKMQVTLECQRQDWRMERGDAIGFVSELRLTAHPFLPFRQVRVSFDIPREEACSARW